MILGLQTWQFVVLLQLFGLFFITAVAVVWYLLARMRWPVRVSIWENISGEGFIPTRKDRARLIGFGDGGEQIYYLKKLGKFRAAHAKKIGRNLIAWAIAGDGYFYNITFEDLDKKLMRIGVNPVDKSVRLANASIRKGIDKRYESKDFFERWGATITIGMLIIAMIVFIGAMWFMFSQVRGMNAANLEATKAYKELMELVPKVLSQIENVRSGSGITTNG